VPQVPQIDARLTCESLGISVPGRKLVTDLCLDIAAGSFTCMLGTNGAGKTLTMHTRAGLRRPQGGQVLINREQTDQSPRKTVCAPPRPPAADARRRRRGARS